MIGGFVASLLAFAVGAILDFAVTVSPYQHGLNIHTVGLILMIVGAVGGAVSLLALALGSGGRRRKTIVQDSSGNVVQREDIYG